MFVYLIKTLINCFIHQILPALRQTLGIRAPVHQLTNFLAYRYCRINEFSSSRSGGILQMHVDFLSLF